MKELALSQKLYISQRHLNRRFEELKFIIVLCELVSKASTIRVIVDGTIMDGDRECVNAVWDVLLSAFYLNTMIFK